MPYGIKSDLFSAISFIHDDIDSAIARAKLITNHTGRPTEVHTNEPHPLAAFGVAHSNPVTKISPKVAKAPTETLATLSGHNGGDVRTSSCDPEVYPFVLFERGNGGDCICAVHPELGELGRLGATRKEAVGRLKQL